MEIQDSRQTSTDSRALLSVCIFNMCVPGGRGVYIYVHVRGRVSFLRHDTYQH